MSLGDVSIRSQNGEIKFSKWRDSEREEAIRSSDFETMSQPVDQIPREIWFWVYKQTLYYEDDKVEEETIE